jgi:hypothetical protein
MATYVENSGAMRPLNRSIRNPDKKVPEGTPRVITGAVANWQDRTTDLLVNKAQKLTSDVDVHIVLGNRVMGGKDSPSEQKNPNVQKFAESYRELPTEANYAEEFVIPKLAEAGYIVSAYAYDTKVGDEIAAKFVSAKKELFMAGKPFSFVRVAGAGVQLALQFRNAGQKLNPRYDSIKFKPTVYVETDTIGIAWSQAEVDKPQKYQAPQTALRQVALTAKLLHQAAGGK